MKMNLEQINQRNRKLNDRRDKRTEEIKEQIKNLELVKGKIKYRHIIDALKPFMLQVQKGLNASCYKVYGPFGMCCSTSFYFLKDSENRDICKKGNVLGHITIVSLGGGWELRNEKKDTKRYASGTLGYMIGMN